MAPGCVLMPWKHLNNFLISVSTQLVAYVYQLVEGEVKVEKVEYSKPTTRS